MGGKLEYFGLWIDSEFGKGYCSESCTTYRDYKMMSGSKVIIVSNFLRQNDKRLGLFKTV